MFFLSKPVLLSMLAEYDLPSILPFPSIEYSNGFSISVPFEFMEHEHEHLRPATCRT